MRRWILLLALLMASSFCAARAEVPVARLHALARGINLTHWFRFPIRQDDAYWHDYISDAALAQLRSTGFTFVRLAVQPELMLDSAGRVDGARLAGVHDAIERIERQG